MPSSTIRAREPVGASSAVVVDSSAELVEPHLEDAAHFPGGHADGIAKPRTEAEVAWLIAASARVLPIGAQSSVTGGATPNGGLILSTERFTGIEDAGPDRIRCGVGLPLQTLQTLLHDRATAGSSRPTRPAPQPTSTARRARGSKP